MGANRVLKCVLNCTITRVLTELLKNVRTRGLIKVLKWELTDANMTQSARSPFSGIMFAPLHLSPLPVPGGKHVNWEWNERRSLDTASLLEGEETATRIYVTTPRHSDKVTVMQDEHGKETESFFLKYWRWVGTHAAAATYHLSSSLEWLQRERD